MPENIGWQMLWVVAGIGIFVSAILAARSRRAMHAGRISVATLFILGGATFNALFLATGGDYTDFADASYIPFVRSTWRSVVAPNQPLFIGLLIAFEATVGLLALAGKRRTQLALVGAIGFHVALVTFGWAFYAWSIPMVVCFGLLLRAELRRSRTIAAEERVEPPLAA